MVLAHLQLNYIQLQNQMLVKIGLNLGKVYACFHKHSVNPKNRVVQENDESHLRQLKLFYSYKQNLMSESLFGRSADPSKVNIDQQAVDIIKNSLLKYKANSEYYIKVHQQENLNFVMFLCLYQDKMATNKITSAFKNINPGQLEEMKENYFTTRQEVFNIASIFEEKSAMFAYHQQLFKDNAKYFTNLPLNAIFESTIYSKTLRICQYKEKSLTQFKAIPFKAKSIEDNKIQDVIVIFPTVNGYNIGCFSAKNRQVANPSFIEQEEIKPSKTKKKQEKMQEQELEKTEQQSEAMQEQEKMKANPTETLEVQVEEEKFDEEKQLYEQKDYNTFFALLAIFGLILLAHNFL